MFEVNRYKVEKSVNLCADENSFNHILIIDGSGEINGIKAKKGDSFFVPAGFGNYEIKGETEVLITKI